jgi:hypothetical protein
MKKLCRALPLLFPLLTQAQHGLTRIWETDTIVAVPESVVEDRAAHLLYTSLIDGAPWEADGKGGIGTLKPDGTGYNGTLVTGLNAPKGLGLFGNRLYAADISEVVVVDTKRGAIIKKISVPGAIGLNDITVDPQSGDVYVSDSKTGRLWRIVKDIPSLYLENLEGINGLKWSKRGLYILARKSVLLADAAKNLTTITTLPNGGDGVEEAGNGDLVVSEWVGYIYYVKANGEKQLLLDTHDKHKNTADILYDPTIHTLYVPSFNGKTIAAYRLD